MIPTTGRHRRNAFHRTLFLLAVLILAAGCDTFDDPDARLELEWSLGPIGSVPPVTRPLRVGGLVYLQFDNGRMYGFDAATGVVRQTVNLGLGTQVHNPAMAERDGVIYTLGTYGCCAVDATSGQVLWTQASEVTTETTCLEVSGEYVSFGGVGAVQVLDRATGAVVRHQRLFVNENVSSVLVESGIVYISRWKNEGNSGFYTSRIWAISLDTGRLIWNCGISSDERLQTRMLLAGDHLFVHGFHTSYVVSKTTGEVELSLDTRAGYSLGSQPERVGDEVLFAGGTAFHAVDIHSLAVRRIDSRVSTLVLGSRYGFSIEDPWIATSDKGHLALVSLESDEPNVVRALGDGVNGSPLIDEGRVFVSTERGFSCYRIVKD